LHICDDGVAIEGFVGEQTIKFDVMQERGDAHRVKAVARQEFKAHQICQRVGQRENFGRHAAFGAANGLALSPLLRAGGLRKTAVAGQGQGLRGLQAESERPVLAINRSTADANSAFGGG